jgi:hypothetical protein
MLLAALFFSFYILLTPHDMIRENYGMQSRPFIFVCLILFVFVWMCTLLKNIL